MFLDLSVSCKKVIILIVWSLCVVKEDEEVVVGDRRQIGVVVLFDVVV